MNEFHKPVLLQEIIDILQPKAEKRFIDATLGGGGYTFALLEKGATVLALDVDRDAIEYVVKKALSKGITLKRIDDGELQTQVWQSEALIIVKANFRQIGNIAKTMGFTSVDGIVFDLGVSWHQLETAQRGFSFLKNGPLDMRMDTDLGVKAGDLINTLTKGELYDLFIHLGEEHNAHAIVRSIVRARGVRPIETTQELADIISGAFPKRYSQRNKATKVFQALRIAINDELRSLQSALPQAYSLVRDGGKVTVVSFHSLEDRIVKHAFIKLHQEEGATLILKKPLLPSEAEIDINRRSRSAKLRAIEKTLI